MKEDLTFDTIPAKFCGMVEEYRLELAKKSPIELDLNVSLPGKTICGIHETVLISKNFGFIQRLVENDKIDFDKIYSKTRIYTFGKGVSDTDYIIMILSIQDNPIEFLIDILK